MADTLLALNKKLNKLNFIDFSNLLNKYASANGLKISNIINKSSFNNKIYSGRARKIRNFTVNINTNIITIYADKSGSGKYELLKFEENDNFRRQYIKLYLENLTEKQLEKIDSYSGNILKKTLQIEIPDYDKYQVVKKVVKEWENLQQEIEDLEEKIEETDSEIDQMVYELYDLDDDEIEIVEGGKIHG